MSYPSIAKILADKNIDLEIANNLQLRESLWEALQIDLPLGFKYLFDFAQNTNDQSQNTGEDIDPNSLLGKQIIRIIGCDLPKTLFEEKTGVRFGLYNCCQVVAKRGGDPVMDLKWQLKKQFTADC
jgi:hypothetical protein